MWSEAGNNNSDHYFDEHTDFESMDCSDLAGEFEVVACAVAGLDDGLPPVEAGGEHHAQAVQVRCRGATPFVQDLGS